MNWQLEKKKNRHWWCDSFESECVIILVDMINWSLENIEYDQIDDSNDMNLNSFYLTEEE
jgi:hypothetical protein